MAIVQRGSTTTAGNSTGSSFNVTKPTGTVLGDRILIKATTYDTATYNAVTVTGFTVLGHNTTALHAGAGAVWVTILERIADGTEGANFAVNAATSAFFSIECTSWSGAAAIGSSTIGTWVEQTTANPVVPGVTTLDANDEVLIMFSGNNVSATTPAGWSLVSNFGTVCKIYGQVFASAGATGNVTITAAADTPGGYVGAMVALNVSVPGTPTALAAASQPSIPRQATLSWTAPANGGSAITDYLIERAPDVAGSPGTYAAVTHTPQTTTTYADTTATVGSTYWYRVSAINAIGTGSASTAISTVVTKHPHVSASNTVNTTSMGTGVTVTKASTTVGDLVLCVLAQDAPSGALTASTGWAAVATQQVQGSTVIRGMIVGRVLDGGANDTLVINGTAAQDAVYATLAIPAGEHPYTNANITTISSAGTNGSSGNIDPPSVTAAPGTDDYLWITVGILDLTTSSVISAPFASYTIITNQVSANSTTSVALATAYRQFTIGTLNPGVFTNTSRPWIAFTLAIAPASTAGQTITAQVATLALTAVPGTVSAGAVTITAQIATLALTAVPGSVSTVGGPQTITAQVATVTLTALPGTVTAGAVTVTAQIASLALAAVAGGVSVGAATITAQVATLALTAVSGTITAGPVTKTAQIATLALTAVPGVVTPGTATVNAQIASLALTAVPGVVSVGAVTVTAQIATLALTAVPGQVSSGTTIFAQVASLTLTAVPGIVSGGPVSITAQIATVALAAVPGTVTAGPVTKVAQVASLTLTAIPGVVTPGPVSRTAQVATLTLTALPGVVTAGTADQTVAAQVATLTLTAVAGVVTVTAGTAVDPFPERVTIAQTSRVTIAQTSRVTIDQQTRATVDQRSRVTIGQRSRYEIGSR